MQRLSQISSFVDETANQYLEKLLQNALQNKCSDIHIEPEQAQYRIRFRNDGLLNEIEHIHHSLGQRLILTIKIAAQLDITERRLPQDGRYSTSTCHMRVNTCPTLYGEKIVLRLQPLTQSILSLAQLGLSTKQLILFQQALTAPQGLILITGPTGCGKTWTLYAALHHLNSKHSNIITIEDPVEIHLPGTNQVQLNSHVGFHFSTVLRSILRQDPDIIMIGEIRDRETAALTIHAAQTGHLVLASLHTNNTKSAIMRLQTLGINQACLTETLLLIIAQRLVRRTCSHCQGHHCTICHNGYRGRIGIFELLSYQSNPPLTLNMLEAAAEKIQENITTEFELNRVLGGGALNTLLNK